MNKLFVIPIFFFIVSSADGQGTKQDTVFLSSSIKNTKSLYQKWMGAQSHLYNGSSAIRYNSDINLQPFYLSDWEDGSLYYDDELYEDVPLMYDLVSDQLIVSQVDSYADIELVSTKVDWFTIKDHNFIHLGNHPSDKELENGFYEVLYDGNVKLFARRKRIITESIEQQRVVSKVSEMNRYFIYKDGVYVQVKKRSSILKVLNDMEKELKYYSKQHQLDFRRETEASLLSIVSHYDQANNVK